MKVKSQQVTGDRQLVFILMICLINFRHPTSLSMPHPKHTFAILSFLLLLIHPARAQVSLTATFNVPTGSYTTLKAAFDAINAGIHQGQIAISINDTCVETATAILNGNGGTTSYTSVTIMPTATALITGDIAGPLIKLDGADSVKFDGRVGGTGTLRSLTIQNTNSASGITCSALMLVNGANYNQVRFLNIEGATQPYSTSLHNTTIVVGGSPIHNSYNVLANNDIRPVPGHYQGYAISIDNGGGFSNQIINNLIHDFYVPGSLVYGIRLLAQSSNYTISGNSLYNSTSINGGGSCIFIYVGGSVPNAINTIFGNYIGGSQPNCGGAPAFFSGHHSVTGILAGNFSSTVIDSNQIRNIVLLDGTQSTFMGISSYSPVYSVIGNSYGNSIGSMDDTSSIAAPSICGISLYLADNDSPSFVMNNKLGGLTATGDSTGAGRLTGIEVLYCEKVAITGNHIGGDLPGSLKFRGAVANVYGIKVEGGKFDALISCVRDTIRNLENLSYNTSNSNLIGIYCTNQGLAQSPDTLPRLFRNNLIEHLKHTGSGNLHGIYCGPATIGPGSVINPRIESTHIRNLINQSADPQAITSGITVESPYSKYLRVDSNTINNIVTTAQNTFVYTGQALSGINLISTGTDSLSVSTNEVYNLSSFAAGSHTTGINCRHMGNVVPAVLRNNVIFDLNDTVSQSTNVSGISFGHSSAGQYEVTNNMISLSPSAAETYGINMLLSSLQADVDHNSIYIGGTESSNMPSAAFKRNSFVYSNVYLRNNILQNERTGSSGGHFAILNATSIPDSGWAYSDYNNLYSLDTAATVLWGTAPLSFQNYRDTSLMDSCSVNLAADFTGAPNGDLHLTTAASNGFLSAQRITAIPTDIDGDPRNVITSMGADEQLLPGNFTLSIPNGTAACPGEWLTTIPPTDVSWLFNGNPIPGAYGDSLLVTSPGIYTAVFETACLQANASTEIDSAIDYTVSVNGNTLSLAPSATNVQWINCDSTNAAIPGATSLSYTPTVTGNYAAVLTMNGCTDTTDCVPVVISSIDHPMAHTLSIYPNPGKDMIHITNSIPFTDATISILSSDGQVQNVLQTRGQGKVTVPVRQLVPGLYIISIREGGQTRRLKWFKEL